MTWFGAALSAAAASVPSCPGALRHVGGLPPRGRKGRGREGGEGGGGGAPRDLVEAAGLRGPRGALARRPGRPGRPRGRPTAKLAERPHRRAGLFFGLVFWSGFLVFGFLGPTPPGERMPGRARGGRDRRRRNPVPGPGPGCSTAANGAGVRRFKQSCPSPTTAAAGLRTRFCRGFRQKGRLGVGCLGRCRRGPPPGDAAPPPHNGGPGGPPRGPGPPPRPVRRGGGGPEPPLDAQRARGRRRGRGAAAGDREGEARR